ncbi:hypothetical protein BDK51DRAFT_46204 [Blyttiomyces helicus]|uniref:Uncharacterized protein n=1 Tax=Blyttiomyces helicus TaxID=388810 RepID=A0A4P9W3N4_9FUNG|nr:hypothetical protein BDK51DRAFT_46204 [Blyttiomyces helicus]|eukprot:RKO86754.1 hypothetical protein BDK51DRAFT_46204 [Blyttiomyces helicus]
MWALYNQYHERYVINRRERPWVYPSVRTSAWTEPEPDCGAGPAAEPDAVTAADASTEKSVDSLTSGGVKEKIALKPRKRTGKAVGMAIAGQTVKYVTEGPRGVTGPGSSSSEPIPLCGIMRLLTVLLHRSTYFPPGTATERTLSVVSCPNPDDMESEQLRLYQPYVTLADAPPPPLLYPPPRTRHAVSHVVHVGRPQSTTPIPKPKSSEPRGPPKKKKKKKKKKKEVQEEGEDGKDGTAKSATTARSVPQLSKRSSAGRRPQGPTGRGAMRGEGDDEARGTQRGATATSDHVNDAAELESRDGDDGVRVVYRSWVDHSAAPPRRDNGWDRRPSLSASVGPEAESSGSRRGSEGSVRHKGGAGDRGDGSTTGRASLASSRSDLSVLRASVASAEGSTPSVAVSGGTGNTEVYAGVKALSKELWKLAENHTQCEAPTVRSVRALYNESIDLTFRWGAGVGG